MISTTKQNLCLFNFNNYFNRTIKRYDTVAEYGTPVLTVAAVNFNPNDGVNGACVINTNNLGLPTFDYLLVVNADNTIASRWFVIEITRLCAGQYNCILKRDVIAENINEFLNATALIEKGIVSDDNPLIYNNEPIPTNQIKTKEYELSDDTRSAWIVGYIARNTSYNNGGSTTKNKMTLEPSVIIPDITVTSLSNWDYNKYVGKKLVSKIPDPYFDYSLKDYSSNMKGYRNFYYDESISLEFANTGKYDDTLRVLSFNDFTKWLKTKEAEINEKNKQYNKLYFPADISVSQTDYDGLSQLNGKILKSGDSYYRVIIKINTKELKIDISENKQGIYMRSYLYDLFNSYNSQYIYDHGFYGRYVWNCDIMELTLEPMTYGSYYCEFPDENNRYHLKDAPYDMFAIPYSDKLSIQIPKGGTNVKISKILAISLAQEIARKLDSNLYDLQLLPYCPFGGYDMSGLTMGLTDTNAKRYTAIKDDTNTVKAYMIWCTASSGTKNIIMSDLVYYKNKKLDNQCDMYRLVSPNFSGQFEFNLAKNNTKTLDTFNVDFTYMPYNPYIHITPVPFSGLYGSDFNDARGLICGGDFSLARVTDAWQNYQLQNKNYQAIFNRQIDNMDVKHGMQMAEASVQAIAGSFQASAAGAVAGPVGAIVGGVLGLAAGAADVGLQAAAYSENKSYAQDMHRYQLDNIRALPYSLSKTTAFTFNNKVFPILEYYTCTETEKVAIANEIANTGMTIGVVGNIGDYAYNEWSYGDITSRGFIKGKLIRIEGLDEDYHLAQDIANEFNKGVYLL